MCPGCDAEVPLSATECPLCGHEFQRWAEDGEGEAAPAVDQISKARLIEVDVLNRSPFAWEAIGDDGMVATGFRASAAVKRIGDVWVAVGLQKGEGNRTVALPLRVG